MKKVYANSREQARAWYKKNADRVNTQRRRRYEEDSLYSDRVRSQSRKWSDRARPRLRLEVITHYSNGANVCKCCGEDHIPFLTIDHVNGGGLRHRRDLGNNFYPWLKRNGFPNGFQVLCMNCNFAKWRVGVCPHELETHCERARA